MLERYERLGPPPDEALARLMKMREGLGITRIADITGLDQLGIPVVQVTRPFSLSNAVAQGKGATLAQAAISAMLESAESFFAEQVANFDTVVGCADQLGIPPDRFERHLQGGTAPGWRGRETAWVAADNLLTGSRDLVPFELVHTAYVLPSLPHDGIFAASTSGLAAGFVEPDAIVHGMLECIEREAIATAYRTHGFFHRQRIDPETIDDPSLRDLLETLAAKNVLVGLWQALSPLGIPVVWCHLLEDEPTETVLLDHPADGSAAGFSPAGAAAHAIYEAAQARLAAISGARDDLTRAFYPKYPDRQIIAAHRRLLRDGPRSVDFRALAEQKFNTASDGLSVLLAILEERGFDAVHLIRVVTKPLDALSVVRIVIPALQPLLQG